MAGWQESARTMVEEATGSLALGCLEGEMDRSGVFLFLLGTQFAGTCMCDSLCLSAFSILDISTKLQIESIFSGRLQVLVGGVYTVVTIDESCVKLQYQHTSNRLPSPSLPHCLLRCQATSQRSFKV